MSQMTPAERAATDAFRLDLLEQFATAADAMWKAHESGAAEDYDEAVRLVRVLYREIREVEFVLATGILPFDVAQASRAT